MPLTSFAVDRGRPQPLYRQLYAEIRAAILAGRLSPGARLPSTRLLASELGLSRNTVALAFDQLGCEGYIEGRTGSGTRVSKELPDALLTVRRDGQEAAPRFGGTRGLSCRGQALAALGISRTDRHPAFALAAPDSRLFPSEAWGRIAARCWRRSRPQLLEYRDPSGYRPLREAIVAYLGAVRALACTAEQVMVVSGAQAGLDFAARVLLDPGDRVWMEEPGYGGLRAAFTAAGAVPVPVPVDAEGLSVDAGTRRAPDARLAAVTPSHQFPLGITMSLGRRLALIEWARQADAWIVEDDYDSEYRYAGRPVAALQGLDPDRRVIYVGTFSKVLFPAIRLGYLVLPPDLVDAFRRARSAIDDHPSILVQPVLAEFIAAGHFAAHVRRTRLVYAARQAALVEAMRRYLDGLLTVAPDAAGMHLVADMGPRLAARMGDREAAGRAQAAGVTVAPLSTYYARGNGRRGLLLGYAAANEAEIDRGAAQLAEALRS